MKKRLFPFLLACALVLNLLAPLAVFSAEAPTFSAIAGTNGNSGESWNCLTDGKKTQDNFSKWCLNFPEPSNAFVIFKASSATAVTGYTLTTGNDNERANGRNPKNWTFYGSNDYDESAQTGNWTSLHSVTDDTVMKDQNFTSFSFGFDNTVSYQYYKMEITANQGGNCLQLGEVEFTSCAHSWGSTQHLPAACTEPQYDRISCSICSAVKTQTLVGAALGHVAGTGGKCSRCSVLLTNSVGDLTVIGGVPDTDFSFLGGVLTIKSGVDMTVQNKNPATPSTNRIVIANGTAANLTLKNLNLDVSETDNAPALSIADNSTADVTLTLADKSVNTLKSGKNCAALQKNGNASGVGTLTIRGGGALLAVGGENGAAIGGGNGQSSMHLYLLGGAVTATGGKNASAVGGGNEGDGDDVQLGTLSLKATAGEHANTFGGGATKAAVLPTDGSEALYCCEIPNPNGDGVVLDGVIQSRLNHSALGDTTLYLYLKGCEHRISVNIQCYTYTFDTANGRLIRSEQVGNVLDGLTISLSADKSGETPRYALDYHYENRQLTILSDKAMTLQNLDPAVPSSDRIVIADGVAANLTLKNLNLDVSATDNVPAFSIADNSTADVTLTLADGSVNTLKSGKNCAALQKNGNATEVGTLTVRGGGALLAVGGENGAAIGGGNGQSSMHLYLLGGIVTATGGKNASAVGGGNEGDGEDIQLGALSLKATAGEHANTFGGGATKAAVLPTDGSEVLYLHEFSNPNRDYITVNGKGYRMFNHSALDPADTNLYVYMKATSDVTVILEKRTYTYNSTTQSFTYATSPINISELLPFSMTTNATLRYGYDYTYENKTLTILSNQTLTLANKTPKFATDSTVTIAKNVSVSLTLNGLNIDASTRNGAGALVIEDGSLGNVTVTLADKSVNTLKSGENCAGLQKNGNADNVGTLTVQGNGSLTAVGGLRGAGIGGGNGQSARNIQINGGTVTANGNAEKSYLESWGAAGIGGGYHGDGSYLSITSGTVTATGYGSGTGIGGGHAGNGSYITVSGGTVTAQCKLSNGSSAGIGGGRYADGHHITISGGTVTATGENYAAGIGGGEGAGWMGGGNGYDITISGGIVTAIGGKGGAGIGSGNNSAQSAYNNYTSGYNITVSGGYVVAKGGDDAAGIGGGWYGRGFDIWISGASVQAVSGSSYAQNIGSGNGRTKLQTLTNAAENGEEIYLLVVPNPNGETAYSVDGKADISNGSDLYLYLTGTTHTLKLGDTETHYHFVNGSFEEAHWSSEYTYDDVGHYFTCADDPNCTATSTKEAHLFEHYVSNNDASTSPVGIGSVTAHCTHCSKTDTRADTATVIPAIEALYAQISETLNRLNTALNEKADAQTVSGALQELQNAVTALEEAKNKLSTDNTALKAEYEQQIQALQSSLQNAADSLQAELSRKADTQPLNEALQALQNTVQELQNVPKSEENGLSEPPPKTESKLSTVSVVLSVSATVLCAAEGVFLALTLLRRKKGM